MIDDAPEPSVSPPARRPQLVLPPAHAIARVEAENRLLRERCARLEALAQRGGEAIVLAKALLLRLPDARVTLRREELATPSAGAIRCESPAGASEVLVYFVPASAAGASSGEVAAQAPPP